MLGECAERLGTTRANVIVMGVEKSLSGTGAELKRKALCETAQSAFLIAVLKGCEENVGKDKVLYVGE